MCILRNAKQLLLSGSLLLAVSPALAMSTTTTSLAVVVAGSPVTSTTTGTAITLKADVLAGTTPVSPGQVYFCDASATYCTDIHRLGTAQLTSTGSATLKFIPGAGNHTYKAIFAGTNNDAASSSDASPLEVSGPIPSIVQINHSGGASDYTLTATVGGVGTATPGGTATFQNAGSSSVLGTATLGAGTFGLTFGNSSNTATGNGPSGLGSGDFNGDGKRDVVVSNCYPNEVDIYLGNGDGTLTEGQTLRVDNCVGGALVADFNGDGKEDLALSDGSDVTILLGKGDGNFTGQKHYPTGDGAQSVVTADFNHDGIADLATINFYDQNVTVLIGKGDGSFSAGPITAVPDAYSFATADFNADGIPDLVTSDEDGDLTLWLGNGDGTFAAVAASAGNVGFLGNYVIADFNADGKTDLVDANGILLGNGDGTFTPAPPSLKPGAGGLLTGDFNGDGLVDLAVSSFNNYPEFLNALTVLSGSGDGKFATAVVAPTTFVTPSSLITADFNGDGRIDLAALDSYKIPILLSATRSASASISNFVVPVASSGELVQASYAGDDLYSPKTSITTSLDAFTSQLSSDNLVFAPTHVGDNSGYQKITYTNTGTGTLHFRVQGPDFGFDLRNQTCKKTLAPGKDCTFSVVFRPEVYGDYDDITMWVLSNANDSQQELFLSGVGLGPDLEPYPAKLGFEPTTIGETAGYKDIVLKNFGNVPMTIHSIAITNTTDFYSWGIRENTCGSTLKPNQRCSLRIAFRPTRVGMITADLTVDDMIGSWQKKIPLTGTGREGVKPSADLVLSPTTAKLH